MSKGTGISLNEQLLHKVFAVKANFLDKADEAFAFEPLCVVILINKRRIEEID